jgi:hypothetical protein
LTNQFNITKKRKGEKMKFLKVIAILIFCIMALQSANSQLLTEDFESGIFPPSGWSNPGGNGFILWNNYSGISGFGTGNYSAFYDGYYWDGDVDSMITPVFSPAFGESVIFDYSYAPYDDGLSGVFSDLKIYYRLNGNNNWYLLESIPGTTLQTAPLNSNFFTPTSSEWATHTYLLPNNTVQLSFVADNFSSNSLFIDNIKVDLPPTMLSEDFESGLFPPLGWSNPGGAGSILWSSSPLSAFGNGNYSTYYDGYWWDGDVDSLITKVFAPVSGKSLMFNHAYAPYNDGFNDIYSDLYIYYRLNGDNTWYLFDTIPGTTLQTSPGTGSYFTPFNNEWGLYTSALPNNTVQLSFVADNFSSNNLYLDNIKVDIPPTGSDLAVQQVYAKGQYARTYLTGDTIRASIVNQGGTALSNVYVYLQLSGANNRFDSVLVPSIVPGQTKVVSFAPYTPVMSGHTTVKVFVAPDDITSNDEAFYNMNVGSKVLSYNDTTSNYCCGIGWFGEGYWLSKYRLTDANTRIKSVNVRVTGAPGSTNQVVRGVILNSAGVIVAKSDPYKIKATDNDKMLNFKLSDPLPHKIASSNSTFYVGIEQTALASTDDAYGIQGSQDETPTRQDAYFAAYGMKPVGQSVGYIYPWTSGNRWGIEAVISPITSNDVGISNLGMLNDQYFTSATIQPKGRVHNNATSGNVNATVIRKITPGGYTSSQSVNIPANSSLEVTFANWTFTSGTVYNVTDSIVLAGDTDLSDNVIKGTVTPRVAKQLAVVWSNGQDRDSLVRAINTDGRFASNFDTIPMHYTGSLRPFKYVFMNFRRAGNWTDAMRDSIKAFIDASTAANKKSFVLFHNTVTYVDPDIAFSYSPADTIFLRQYLKARFVANDWQINVPADRKFKGKNFFSSVTQDSVYDEYNGNYYPDLIRPVNGSFAAFVPRNITGTGNDSAIAVAYAGPNYNTFVMSNQFHALRAKNGGLTDGPGRIFARIIDWINSTNSSAKVLDLKLHIEGFYDQGLNQMNPDTVRVYLRNTTSPYAIVDSAKGLLNSSGMQSFVFNNASNGTNYYIHVKHRNAIETWSRTGGSFTSNYRSYDFTTDSGKAFGFNMVKKGTKWVFYGGDVNQDGFIDGTDNNLIDNDAYNFISGYVKTDLNGDDFVDATDFSISDNNANSFIGKITPNSEPLLLARKGIVIVDQPSLNLSPEGDAAEIKIDHEIYEKYKYAETKEQRLRTIKKGNTTFMIAE